MTDMPEWLIVTVMPEWLISDGDGTTCIYPLVWVASHAYSDGVGDVSMVFC